MAIQDLPVYVCRKCKTTWVGDDRMYEEPERCPACGHYNEDSAPDPADDVEP